MGPDPFALKNTGDHFDINKFGCSVAAGAFGESFWNKMGIAHSGAQIFADFIMRAQVIIFADKFTTCATLIA